MDSKERNRRVGIATAELQTAVAAIDTAAGQLRGCAGYEETAKQAYALLSDAESLEQRISKIMQDSM